MKIRQKKVKDIRSLLVQDATVISSDATMGQALKKMLEDQRTRHVYVIDETNVIIGMIRLTDVVEFIMSYLPNLKDDSFEIFLHQYMEKNVKTIMEKKPVYLQEETLLEEMLSIMVEHRVDELPVVNESLNVIGEVNFLEFVKFLSDGASVQAETR